jgi:hypothetical protein
MMHASDRREEPGVFRLSSQKLGRWLNVGASTFRAFPILVKAGVRGLQFAMQIRTCR